MLFFLFTESKVSNIIIPCGPTVSPNEPIFLFMSQMHIEAAKLLQFSEEEFVKALDWGS